MTGYSTRELGELDTGAIAAFLDRSGFVPWRFLSGSDSTGLVRSWMRELTDLSSSRDDLVALVCDGHDPVGLVACCQKPWDSEALGARAGEIRHLVVPGGGGTGRRELLRELCRIGVDWACGNRVEYLVCRVHSEDVVRANVLEESGFELKDTLLDYVYDYRRMPLGELPGPALAEDVVVREAESRDADGLVDVALAAFARHFGRFHSDERIGAEAATAVYGKWIRDSLAGYADWVVLAEVGGRVAGYSVWRKPSKDESLLPFRLGHYSIGAVHPEFSGRRLFSALTYRGMENLAPFADLIEGPTHVRNHAVQRAYAHLGWGILDARHTFRKWLDSRG